jgi:hypothetical protein
MYDTDDIDNPQSAVIQHAFEVETGRSVAIRGLISPDEKRVVIFEQGAIAVQASDGSNRIELAQSKDEPTLSWSADGQMLSMWTKGGRQSVLSADGKSVRRNDFDQSKLGVEPLEYIRCVYNATHVPDSTFSSMPQTASPRCGAIRRVRECGGGPRA